MEICQYKEYCGGCQLQGKSYQSQLKIKQERIEKLLSKYSKVSPIIKMEDPLRYRNKIQVSFGLDENKKVIYGNYVPSTHIIVPFDKCMLADIESLKIIKTFKELIVKYKISIFNENSLKGCIRHLQIRCTNLNEYMVIIVSGSNYLNKADLIINDLIKKHPLIKTIVLNFNRNHTSMILGNKNTILYGKGYIKDVLCGLEFNLSCSSFYQVNKRQTEILYNTAFKMADLKGDEIAIDAYCGIGTISLALSKKVKRVYGVEINKNAIKDAIKNAKYNNIQNVSFYSDDAGHYMDKLSKENMKVDVVFMDPPRTGADIRFLKSLIKLGPNKIIYISCGPDSLKENLQFITKYGYKVNGIQPVDMFPFTEHVETVCLLSRKP